MIWRWLIYDYIPPELDIPRRRQRDIRKQVQAEAREIRQKSGWRLTALSLICMAIFMFSYKYILKSLMPQRFPYDVVFLVTFPLIIYVFVALIWRSRYEKRTFRLLHQYGYNICLTCGYLLQGLEFATDRCPECGTKREALPEPSPEEHADLQ